MFEIHVGELRATFLRNHNMRRHKDPTKCPKQKTTQAQQTEDPQAEDNPSRRQPKPRRQPKLRRRPHPRQPPQPPQARGAAPDKGRCTRYVAAHPNRRGALPTDRVQCPNTQEQTRNWHTESLTAAPLHAQLGPTGGRTGTPPTPPTLPTPPTPPPALRPTPTPALRPTPPPALRPTPTPALRPTPTPPTPLHAKSQ